MAPVAAPPTVALADTVTGVLASPKVMVEAPTEAATVPAMDTAEGAVATTPLEKVVVPPEVPIVTVPVFPNVVVPATVFAAPVKATL